MMRGAFHRRGTWVALAIALIVYLVLMLAQPQIEALWSRLSEWLR